MADRSEAINNDTASGRLALRYHRQLRHQHADATTQRERRPPKIPDANCRTEQESQERPAYALRKRATLSWSASRPRHANVKRSELRELHYITAIDNLASILELGILSYRRAEQVEHTSVAMDEIQRRRANVVVPGGRPLHEYACLYICGRNVMLYKRRGQHDRICVMQVVSDVLDLPGVVVTDANASSDYVRFSAAPAGLRIVDRELTFAESWTDADPNCLLSKKNCKMRRGSCSRSH